MTHGMSCYRDVRLTIIDFNSCGIRVILDGHPGLIPYAGE